VTLISVNKNKKTAWLLHYYWLDVSSVSP